MKEIKIEVMKMKDKKTKVIINNEIAVKPYYYVRNNLIHARYSVDRAIELTEHERELVKAAITKNPEHKQDLLAKQWNLLENFVKRELIKDGIKEAETKYIKGAKND